MPKLLEHHKDIMDFLRAHGAQDISTENTKRGHVKINFMWRGERLNYITSGTPSDHRATLNAIAHLRSRLGAPMESPAAKVKRTLAELTADIPLKTHGSPELDEDAAKLIALGADPGPTLEDIMPTPSIIKLSDVPPTQDHDVCYIGLYNKGNDKKVLRISIPNKMHEQIGAPQKVTVSRVDGNTWKIAPNSEGTNAFSRYNTTRKGYMLVECLHKEVFRGLDTWGLTPSEGVAVDGSLLVSIDLSNLKTKKRITDRTTTKKLVVKDKQVSPYKEDTGWQVPSTMPKINTPNPVGTTKEEIRHALDVISHVANTMPVKLVRKGGRYEFILDLD